MAVAIENSLLFQERRRAADVLELLAGVSGALFSSLDRTEVLSKLVTLLVPRLADCCMVDVL
jgi:hypothetical protein